PDQHRMTRSTGRPPPRSTISPYTTLSRSWRQSEDVEHRLGPEDAPAGDVPVPEPTAPALEGLVEPARCHAQPVFRCVGTQGLPVDRKSTRLNSRHVKSSYAGFC